MTSPRIITAASLLALVFLGVEVFAKRGDRGMRRVKPHHWTWASAGPADSGPADSGPADTGETASLSGFVISDLQLQKTAVQNCLSIPEPPDASVRYVDGGAGLSITASNDWIDCGGTDVQEIDFANGVTHVYVANCVASGGQSSFQLNQSNEHIELFNVDFSHTTGGQQTLANLCSNCLFNDVTISHTSDYCIFASDFDDSTYYENVIWYNSKCKYGSTQSGIRIDGLHCSAWANSTWVSNSDNSPHALRFQGGREPDAGSGDTGLFGAHNVEVLNNDYCGGNGVWICNLNDTETCGDVFFHDNVLVTASSGPDPWAPDCDQSGYVEAVNNQLHSTTAYNPWNQGTGGCAPDANVHHQYDAATLPDGGCAF